MKILKLRFKNLNSLVGEWEIDFTNPQYTSDGIFAISGPTGAGKSTILDGICLALYGCTPRLKTISSSTNEIMSRNTGECFSEVIFQTQKGTYISNWSQSKARKHPLGNLQQPKFEVAKIDGTILETQIKKTQDAIVELTGMEFNRFTQSMMLAQGGFAAFLQANANERAPILEDITGTEIYSSISKLTYERTKDEKSKLDIAEAETKGIVLLSSEDVSRLQEDFVVYQSREDKEQGEKKKIEESIKWIKDIKILKNEIENLEKEQNVHKLVMEPFLPNRQKLERAQKAVELEAGYVSLINMRETQAKDHESLAKSELQSPIVKTNWDVAIQVHSTSEEQLKATEVKAEGEKKKITEVRAIDTKIAAKKIELKSAKDKNNELEKGKKETSEKLEHLKQEKDRSILKQSEANTYLDRNKRDEILITELGGIKVQFKNWDDLKTNTIEAKTQVEESEKELSNLNLQFKIATNNVEIAKNNKEVATKKHVEIQNNIEQLLNDRKLAEIKSELNLLNKNLFLIRKIESLEDERKNLEDEKECPLCGSRHHPYALENVPVANETEQKIDELTNLLDSIDKQDVALKVAQQDDFVKKDLLLKEESNYSNLKEKMEQITKNVAEQKISENNVLQKYISSLNELGAALKPIGIISIEENKSENILINLQKRLQLWNDNKKIKSDIDLIIVNLASEIKSQETLFLSEIKNRDSYKIILEKLQNEFTVFTEERTQLFGIKDANEEENKVNEQLSQTQKEEKNASDNRLQVKNEFDALQLSVTTLQESIAQRTPVLETNETSLKVKLQASEFVDETDFVNAKLSSEMRTELLNNATELDNKQIDIQAREVDRKTKLQIEITKDTTTESLEELQKQLETVAEIVNTCIANKASIKTKLESNNSDVLRFGNLQSQIDLQKIECRKWELLNTYIGSADGKKFRNFAQGLTFEIMVSHANTQLIKLTDRYMLIRDKVEPLNLNIIDNYQAGEVRSTKNLSGGESFLISMALALGLSQMSSRKVRVDSLFLDEGFGTLDEETLEIALETLASLHQEGKLIGVISHVSSLKERINAKIEVIKESGGKSRIIGPGCSRVS
jgi:exonuclease SbcC